EEDRAARAALAAALGRLGPEQRYIHGLYAGGTLAQEALRLLGEHGHAVASNLDPKTDLARPGHKLVDLGDDEFTRGRAHPMIDPRTRHEHLLAAARDPSVAVLLFDVVLGIGSHPDPAGAMLPALAEITAQRAGRPIIACAAVVGTDADPQP